MATFFKQYNSKILIIFTFVTTSKHANGWKQMRRLTLFRMGVAPPPPNSIFFKRKSTFYYVKVRKTSNKI